MKKLLNVFAFILTTAMLAAQPRFIDNGDGTITDNGAGLVWQKCSYGQSPTICSGTATKVPWRQALQYCRNLTLNGRSWRLPSVNELGSIVYYSMSYPAINTVFFPNTEADSYWSSSTGNMNGAIAWYVIFNYGYMNTYEKSQSFCVRCVADGP